MRSDRRGTGIGAGGCAARSADPTAALHRAALLGNEDGRPSAMNDHDEIAFVARLADGTDGIFVLPEPGSPAGLLAGALALTGLRAWRRAGPGTGRRHP